MRITELQWTRLKAARDYDDIAIQEHVRRALDRYLDNLDTRRERAPTPKPQPAHEVLPDFVRAQAAVQTAEVPGRRRVVYR